MIALKEVYTLSDVAEPAITTILGVGILKVIENIFEHNNNSIFGKSKEKENDEQ